MSETRKCCETCQYDGTGYVGCKTCGWPDLDGWKAKANNPPAPAPPPERRLSRDEWAAAALTGMLANSTCEATPAGFAKDAYVQADAMPHARDAAAKKGGGR